MAKPSPIPRSPLAAPLYADLAGLLNARAAYLSPALGSANADLHYADGFARSIYPLIYGQPLVWRDPTYHGIPWNSLTWSSLIWNQVAWNNIAWDNFAWDSVAWDSSKLD